MTVSAVAKKEVRDKRISVTVTIRVTPEDPGLTLDMTNVAEEMARAAVDDMAGAVIVKAWKDEENG